MSLDWRKYREHGGKGPRRQAQPGQGERHLVPVLLLPIKLIIAVICGIALNKLRYNALRFTQSSQVPCPGGLAVDSVQTELIVDSRHCGMVRIQCGNRREGMSPCLAHTIKVQ